MQNLQVARGNGAKLAACGAIGAGPKNAGLNVNFAPQSWQRHTKRPDAPDCQLLFGSKPNSTFANIGDNCGECPVVLVAGQNRRHESKPGVLSIVLEHS